MSSITAGTTSTTTLVHSGDTTGSLVFKTNDTGSGGTTAVTIDTSQNVGIGTSSPTQKLTVSGAIQATSNSSNFDQSGAQFDYASGAGRISSYISTGSNLQFLTNPNGGASAERMRIDSSGNVGIGITSYSGYKLSVGASKTNVGFELYSSGSGSQGGYLNFRPSLSAGNEYNCSISAYDHSGDTNTDGISINGYDGVSFCTGSNSRQERMRIDSSGNLLISTARSSARGLVDIPTVGGSSSVCLGISRGGDAGTMVNFYSTNSSTTVIGSIGNSGNTNTTYNTSSDYRLKDEVTPMSGALNKVSALRPVTWKWKSTGADGQGFVAHELAEVIPDCVTGEKDAVDADGNPVYQGVDTSYLVATLTKAIQELKAINDQQAETINALTARVVALESRGTV